MRYYLCKFFAALNFYRGKWPYALSLGFGFLLGIIPSGNIPLLWLFLVLACTIPMNHLSMLAIQFLVHFFKTMLLPMQLTIGTWLLENPLLYNTFRLLDNIPIIPWFNLARADTLGALCLGMVVGPLLALFYSILFPLLRFGKYLLLQIRWQDLCHKITNMNETHFPQVVRIFQSPKIRKWGEEYAQGIDTLRLAETVQKQTKQREQQQPDFY